MPRAVSRRLSGWLPGDLDGGQQVIGDLAGRFLFGLAVLLGHGGQDILPLEGIDIGHILDRPGLDQLFDDLDAQAGDIHGAARDEMLHVAHQLGRAGGVDAVPGHLALEMLDRLPAGGTGRGRNIGLFRAGAQVHDRADDVGDDLAGALDQHPVADADILLGDIVEVVQGGIPDDDAIDLDRLQDGLGGQHTRAADLHLDAQQLRGDFTGRELEGDGAARVLADEAQLARQGQVVDLDDHAVGLVGQFVAALVPGDGVGDGLLDIVETPGLSVTGKPSDLRYASSSHWELRFLRV